MATSSSTIMLRGPSTSDVLAQSNMFASLRHITEFQIKRVARLREVARALNEACTEVLESSNENGSKNGSENGSEKKRLQHIALLLKGLRLKNAKALKQQRAFLAQAARAEALAIVGFRPTQQPHKNEMQLNMNAFLTEVQTTLSVVKQDMNYKDVNLLSILNTTVAQRHADNNVDVSQCNSNNICNKRLQSTSKRHGIAGDQVPFAIDADTGSDCIATSTLASTLHDDSVQAKAIVLMLVDNDVDSGCNNDDDKQNRDREVETTYGHSNTTSSIPIADSIDLHSSHHTTPNITHHTHHTTPNSSDTVLPPTTTTMSTSTSTDTDATFLSHASPPTSSPSVVNNTDTVDTCTSSEETVLANTKEINMSELVSPNATGAQSPALPLTTTTTTANTDTIASQTNISYTEATSDVRNDVTTGSNVSKPAVVTSACVDDSAVDVACARVLDGGTHDVDVDVDIDVDVDVDVDDNSYINGVGDVGVDIAIDVNVDVDGESDIVGNTDDDDYIDIVGDADDDVYIDIIGDGDDDGYMDIVGGGDVDVDGIVDGRVNVDVVALAPQTIVHVSADVIFNDNGNELTAVAAHLCDNTTTSVVVTDDGVTAHSPALTTDVDAKHTTNTSNVDGIYNDDDVVDVNDHADVATNTHGNTNTDTNSINTDYETINTISSNNNNNNNNNNNSTSYTPTSTTVTTTVPPIVTTSPISNVTNPFTHAPTSFVSIQQSQHRSVDFSLINSSMFVEPVALVSKLQAPTIIIPKKNEEENEAEEEEQEQEQEQVQEQEDEEQQQQQQQQQPSPQQQQPQQHQQQHHQPHHQPNDSLTATTIMPTTITTVPPSSTSSSLSSLLSSSSSAPKPSRTTSSSISSTNVSLHTPLPTITMSSPSSIPHTKTSASTTQTKARSNTNPFLSLGQTLPPSSTTIAKFMSTSPLTLTSTPPTSTSTATSTSMATSASSLQPQSSSVPNLTVSLQSPTSISSPTAIRSTSISTENNSTSLVDADVSSSRPRTTSKSKSKLLRPLQSSSSDSVLRRDSLPPRDSKKLRSGDFSNVDADIGDSNSTAMSSFKSITVSEPRTQKKTTFNSYTAYWCTATKTNGDEFEIERRFSDFLSLQTAIRKQYPTLKVLLPSLPEKKILGKFKPSFVEKRRLGLQNFLEAIVSSQSDYRLLSTYLQRFFSPS